MSKASRLSPIKRLILKHVDCYDLLSYYGRYAGPRVEVFTFCPFHMETKPSARAYTDGLIYCFGCQKMIDPLSYVMQEEDLLQNGAIAFLEKNFHFKLDLANINKLDFYEDDSAINKLTSSVLYLKHKIPFDDYFDLWRSLDMGYLSEDMIKKKRDYYKC